MIDRFYKDDSRWLSQRRTEYIHKYPPSGEYILVIDEDKISIVGVKSGTIPLIMDTVVTSIQKNSSGDYYESIDEFELATSTFFTSTNNAELVNSEGDIISPINPLSVSPTLLNSEDIDWDSSEFIGWVGDPKDLFGNVNNGGLYNDLSSNPKEFILRLKRTRIMRTIGIGASIGDFSNIRITTLGSADSERGYLDLSQEDSKQNSIVFQEEEVAFNAVKIEFLTTDRVDITNLFFEHSCTCRKDNYIHKFGFNEDIDTGEIETIWTLGDQYIFTTTPQNYYISSSSPSDTSQTIEGELLVIDDDGKYRREIYSIQLNGQSGIQIPTTNGWLCIASNRAFNTGVVPLSGEVYIYEDTTISSGVPTDLSKVRSHIAATREQTEQAVYTVPQVLETGQMVVYAELYNWSASATRSRTTSGIFDLYVSKISQTARVQSTRALSTFTESIKNYGENTPLIIEAGSDVYLNVSELTLSSVAVEGGFTIKLVTL